MLSEGAIRRLCAEFGAKIRAARKHARLTPKALGDLVGLSRSSIVNLEVGRQRAPLHVVWRLADALDLPIAELLPDPQVRKTVSKPAVYRVLKQEPRLDEISSGSARRVREFVTAKLSETPVESTDKEK